MAGGGGSSGPPESTQAEYGVKLLFLTQPVSSYRRMLTCLPQFSTLHRNGDTLHLSCFKDFICKHDLTVQAQNLIFTTTQYSRGAKISPLCSSTDEKTG